MSALITTAIERQSYEVIAAKVATILALELPNQDTLNTTEDLAVSGVYLNRYNPTQEIEGTIVNVLFPTLSYDRKTQTNRHTTTTIFIDVYAQEVATSSDTDYTDQKSLAKAQRLLGICSAILDNPVYKKLGFENGFILGTNVTTIQMEDAANRKDLNAMAMGRVTFNVRANDDAVPQQGIELINAIIEADVNGSGKINYTEYDFSQ